MKIKTKHFGEIDIDENKLIEFKEGIPGFREHKKFTLLQDEETKGEEGVFYWLQSVEDEDVAFVLVNMVKVMPEYNPLVPETEVEPLGRYKKESFNFYNIATIPDDVNEMTVNLKAPVLINTENLLGRQVVANNEEYTVRHFMFK